MSTRRFLAYSLMAGTIVLLCLPAVKAVTQSLMVHAGQEETKGIRLAVDDHIHIKFAVAGKTIDFRVTDPSGNIMVTLSATGGADFSFISSKEGTYTLYFSNTASTEDKLVALDYEVTSYIFGIPQTLFLVLMACAVCVGAVAVFILMSKHA